MSSVVPANTNSVLKAFRHHLAPILLFSGVAVLGYAGFQYGAMYLEQRHLQKLWRDQQILNRRSIRVLPSRESELTRISIPSIALTAVVVEGTDLFSLMIGPGHLTGSVLPGHPGNSVISAHRDTFFRNINRLSPGDRILIERAGLTYTYQVETFRIVSPTDLSVVAPTSDSRLTLVTCDPAYYFGPAPKRLVMVSKLIAPIVAPPNVADSGRHSHLHAKQVETKSRNHPTVQ